MAPLNGFNQTVSLAAGSLPAGVTATFPAGSSVNGSGTLSLRLAVGTTVASGTYTITVTGTAIGLLPRSASLTLIIPVFQPQSVVTVGSIPHTTIPADGTVVSVAVPVTYLGSGTLTLRSTSHLPKGVNVKFSGLTLMVSVANGVDPDTYCVDYEYSDGAGNDGRDSDCSIDVGPPGVGGGSPPMVPAPVITSVTSTADGRTYPPNAATLVAGVPTNITIQGRNFDTTPIRIDYYMDGWTPQNPSAPYFPPNWTTSSYYIHSWTDTSINVDIAVPPEATGLWRVGVTRKGYISDYDATHPSTGLLQVFDATPTVGPVTASNGTYTIQGQHFGPNPGSIILCAMSSPTCTQTTPDITLGNITSWSDVLITAALTPQLIHSQSYCVRVSR